MSFPSSGAVAAPIDHESRIGMLENRVLALETQVRALLAMTGCPDPTVPQSVGPSIFGQAMNQSSRG